jgi:methylated-DNA-[protein]-cysteine S-methyltransferase
VPNSIAIFYSRMNSPIGPLLLAATHRGIYRVQFDATPFLSTREAGWIEAPHELSACEEQLREYFRGGLRNFTLPLDLRGSEFQLRCWHALLRIPYGAVSSYGKIAQEIGSPRAFRAVGQANHNNPIAIIVPCHRVIGSDGNLTGYGGGLGVKEKLLLLEAGQLQPSLWLAQGA